MKSSLASVLIALELLTAGLVVALLVKRNEPAALDPSVATQLAELAVKIQGAVSQERQIVSHLDALRQDAAMRSGSGAPGDPSHPTGPGHGSTQIDSAPPAAAAVFPEAAAALAKLKELHRQLREELKAGRQFLDPIKSAIEKAKADLINRGNDATYVVGTEIDLQVFEPVRDSHFVAYLLDEVVPAFAAVAKPVAFRIARSALVRSTNEAPVKLAAAKALQKIDAEAWVKEVIDVIALGSANEIDLRAQLLGLFADSPRPEAVDLCKRFIEDARYPAQLRTKAIMVIEKQDSGAVNPALRSVVFDDPMDLLKNHALDSLFSRLTDPADRKKLLEDVLAIDSARLPDSLREKAQNLLKQISK